MRVTVSPIVFRLPTIALVAITPGVALVPSAAAAASASSAAPKIAFVRFAPTSERLLILTGALEGGPRRALRLPVRDAQGPSWSPDGGRIAFVGGTRAREGAYVATDVDLYVARSNGRSARRLTHDAAREAAPAWSPDGRRLAYVRGALVANRSSVWIVNADGSGARRLTTGRLDLQPAWSPDGKHIAFVRISATNESQIWEVRPDGTGLRRILKGLVGATQPTWSPDGSRLLLTDGQALFTIEPNGSDKRRVARLTRDARGARVDPQPSWSRTGWIAFSQLRPGVLQRSDIWRVRPDGANLERLTRSPGLDSEPSISP